MYSSARIRAIESTLLPLDKMRAIYDAQTYSDAINKLTEYGIEVIYCDDGTADVEETLQRALCDACSLIETCVPHPEQLGFLRYPYDCNNLKAAIKCYFRGISPDGMLFSCGVCPAEMAISAVRGDKTDYPENMARAVAVAMEEYSKSKNPQLIDLILDGACYKDMLECAGASGCDMFIRLVKSKIDITNIITCIRLIRMKMGRAGRALLEGGILSGGTYPTEFYTECYDAGEERLCEALAYSVYDKLIMCVCENPGGLSAVEKLADDIYMEIARGAKSIPFGPEVAAGYLIAVQYQVKNLRVILDMKKTGHASDNFSERMRCLYV